MKRLRAKIQSLSLLFTVLAILAAVLCTGCRADRDTGADRTSAEDGPHRLQVVATIFPQYDFARHIAGDCADVSMLLKPGEEVHSYEPTPQDIRKIQESDLFIYIGGENDVWVDNLLNSGSGPRTLRLLDLVDLYEEAHLEGMMPERGEHHQDHAGTSGGLDHEEEHGTEEDHDQEEGHAAGEGHDKEEGHAAGEDHDHEEEPDEHVWTSPVNCAIIIEKMTGEFCQMDPDHADEYRANGEVYKTRFEELDRQYREMVSSSDKRTIIFGDRFPFRYLAEEYGLTCYAAFSGCSAESEPSAATIAFLIEKTVEEKAPVVFKIEFSNGNIARAISEAAQVRNRSADTPQVLQLHSCQNVTRNEFTGGETCLSLMEKNLEALGAALK